MPPRKSPRGPGRPPRSDEDDGGSRQQLLDAAAKVFAARGYEGASVDAVLKEAGLSKGTFYWNFDSKEDLLFALLEERIDRPMMALLEMTRAVPPEAEMAPVASGVLNHMLEHQRDLLLLVEEYWSMAVRDDKVGDRYREWQTALRGALAQALRERHERIGLPSTLEFDDLATVFMALAIGLTIEALVDPDTVPDNLYSEVLGLMFDGFVLRAQRAEEDGEA